MPAITCFARHARLNDLLQAPFQKHMHKLNNTHDSASIRYYPLTNCSSHDPTPNSLITMNKPILTHVRLRAAQAPEAQMAKGGVEMQGNLVSVTSGQRAQKKSWS